MSDRLRVRVSEMVPRDELWIVERLPWEVQPTPTGFRITEHVKVLGKIVNLEPASR